MHKIITKSENDKAFAATNKGAIYVVNRGDRENLHCHKNGIEIPFEEYQSAVSKAIREQRVEKLVDTDLVTSYKVFDQPIAKENA